MLANVKRGLVASAALAALALGANARAGTVEYYTQGFFVGGSSVANGDTNIDSWSDGKTSIVYYGQTDNTIPGVNGNPTTARLGSFNVSGVANTTDTITGLGFTLDLYQLLPSNGTALLVGQANGTVTDTTSSFGNTSLTVTFSPNAFPQVGDGSYAYTVAASTILQSGTNPANTTLDGTVTQLPLPSTASAGLVALAGLGAVGGLKKLRERNAASLAL